MIVSLISYSEQDEIEQNIDTVILLTQMLLLVAVRCSSRECVFLYIFLLLRFNDFIFCKDRPVV
jgi:hypothetical protein